MVNLPTEVSYSFLGGNEFEEKKFQQLPEKKINEFIQTNFRVLDTNVKHITETEVICLGENHAKEEHKIRNAKLIDLLYKNGSFLLVETSHPPHPLGTEQDKYIQCSIPKEGWDVTYTKEMNKNTEAYVRAEIIVEEGPKTHHFFRHTDQEIEDVSKSCCKLTKLALEFLCIGCFVKACKPCIYNHYEKVVVNTLQNIVKPKLNVTSENNSREILLKVGKSIRN